jgi:diadenylate cyclase
MGQAISFFQAYVQSLVDHFDWRSAIDILIVTILIYWLLNLISGTTAATLVRGILILLTVGFLLSNLLNLTMLGFLLRNAIPALLVAIPILFAPELRRALEQLGRAGTLFPNRAAISPSARVAETLASAAQALSERRWGALIVLERGTPLGEYAATGVQIDGLLSVDLLLNIFYPNSPLHDGAVILHGERVVAAAVLLPLAQSPTIEHMGTRHRAAIGITESNDCVAVVVSEETGGISIANAGRMVRNLGPARLRKVLSILDRASPVSNLRAVPRPATPEEEREQLAQA